MRKKYLIAGIIIAVIVGASVYFMRGNAGVSDAFRDEAGRAFNEAYKFMPDDKIIDMYASVLRVMGELAGKKLTAYDVVRSFTSLYDTATGHNPEYNRLNASTLMMDQSPVRAAYSAIEDSRATRGKLSADEKLIYAYLASYIAENGADNLTLDGLKESLSADSAKNPGKFAFFERERRMDLASSDFAVTPGNPVRAVSIGHSYRYIDRLRTPSGGRVSYSRIGSMMGNEPPGIIDAYTLTFSGDKTMQIYIDPYCAENSYTAPEGLVLMQ